MSIKKKPRRPSMKRGDVVQVKWEDAYSRKYEGDLEPYIVNSFGHLLHADEQYVRIAQSKLEGTEDHYTDTLTIPKPYVRAVRVIMKKVA